MTPKLRYVAVCTLLLLSSDAHAQNREFDVSVSPYGQPTCVGQPGDRRGQNCYDVSSNLGQDSMIAIELHRREQSKADQQIAKADQQIAKMDQLIAATAALQGTIASTYEKHKVELKQTIAAELIARIEALPVSLARNDEAYGELKRRLFEDIERSFGIDREDGE